MIRTFFFRQNEYEKISDVNNDEKCNNLSSHFHDECDNRIEVMPDESLQLENVHRLRMIAPRGDQTKFYKTEQFKAFTAFLFLNASFIVTSISLAITNQRLPDRKVFRPLPDVFLDNVDSVDFLLNVSEIQIMVAANTCIVLIFFHKCRFIVAKRCFFLLSILYLYRSVTFFVTVLPISSQTYYCSPKLNSSEALGVVRRALSVYSGMGLSINHKQTICGDSIFSGHATVLVFSCLVIKEYTPNKLKFLHFLAMLNAAIGILFLLISHAHYTIDVIIAYYITTRLFWSYHQMCLSTNTSSKNYLIREWWTFMFNYFEKHSNRTISNEFEIPWPLNLKFPLNKD